MRPLPSPLIVITDRHQATLPIEEVVEAAAQGGARWLLLRDKDLAVSARRALALRLAPIARRWNMLLSVSADADLAAAVGAGGVHLQTASAVAAARARLADGTVIGVSAHSVADVAAAAHARADYVTLSPIFATPSKPGYGPALGVETLRRATDASVPIFALGGITAARAASCIEAGAAGVAVMGEVMRADDPRAIVASLLAALRRATASRGNIC